MIFLIDYDRRRGEIVYFRAFADADRHAADDARLALELQQKQDKIDREVVVLEAASEANLRRTHRRYFEQLEQLMSEAK
jgi:hypothetical protein